MPQCYVKSCSNYYAKTRTNSKIIYHMLPSSKDLAQKWSELCGFENVPKVLSYARVCSDHFSPTCYQRDLQHELLGLPLRKRLKPDAIPDRNLPATKKPRNSSLEKKSLLNDVANYSSLSNANGQNTVQNQTQTLKKQKAKTANLVQKSKVKENQVKHIKQSNKDVIQILTAIKSISIEKINKNGEKLKLPQHKSANKGTDSCIITPIPVSKQLNVNQKKTKGQSSTNITLTAKSQEISKNENLTSTKNNSLPNISTAQYEDKTKQEKLKSSKNTSLPTKIEDIPSQENVTNNKNNSIPEIPTTKIVYTPKNENLKNTAEFMVTNVEESSKGEHLTSGTTNSANEHAVNNFGNKEKYKAKSNDLIKSMKPNRLPMRSSIRIAKKKSIESLSDSFTIKVNSKKDKNNSDDSERFCDKLKFMAKLHLRFEHNTNAQKDIVVDLDQFLRDIAGENSSTPRKW